MARASGGESPAPALVTIGDYERAAVHLRSRASDYLNRAAADEHTARWNCERFAAYRLMPRTCVDVSRLDTSLELLGTALNAPVFLSPTAGHRLFHPDGEVATAEGAAAAGALWTVSTLASLSLEELSEFATGPFWFQLYMQRDRGFTSDLVARAIEAGDLDSARERLPASNRSYRGHARRVAAERRRSQRFRAARLLAPGEPSRTRSGSGRFRRNL